MTTPSAKGAPSPFTPSLTKKILTMVSNSNKLHYSPSSPADSVTQAMKNDLEELIGYIDGLAFDKMGDGCFGITNEMDTPSANKQLFYNVKDHCACNNGERSGYSAFRDRTNQGKDIKINLRKDPETSVATTNLTAKSIKKYERSSFSAKIPMASIDNCYNLLEPSGTPPNREEPSGSLPSHRSSFYFHDDEPLSVDLSKSDDTDQTEMKYTEQSTESLTVLADAAATTTKPSTSQQPSNCRKNEMISSPEKFSKATSFRSFSSDPTPSKSNRLHCFIRKNHTGGVQVLDEDNCEPFIQLETPARRAISSFSTTVDRVTTEDYEQKIGTAASESNIGQSNSSPALLIQPFGINDHCDAKVNSSVSDSYLSERYREGNITPHPLLCREHGTKCTKNKKCEHDTNFRSATPVVQDPLQQNDKRLSNLVLTSPESAKKLLQTAVDALKDARKERESAREWAKEIKDSAHQWVEEQRKLIRIESLSISGGNPVSGESLQKHHQKIEELINDLRLEIYTPNSPRSNAGNELQVIMARLDTQFHGLSRELTVMKEQLAFIVKECEATRRVTVGKGIKPSSQLEIPSRYAKSGDVQTEHKTPKANRLSLCRNGSQSETSAVSSRGSHRIRRATPNGGHLIDYGNGTTKEVHFDGTTVIRFQNGDVETKFGTNGSSSSSSCVVAYYHSKEEVLQITQKDGSCLYEYNTGQVERHTRDGVKIILFPDGTKTIV